MNDKWHPSNTDSNETIRLRTDIINTNTNYGIDLWLDWHSQINDDSANFLYTYTSTESDRFFNNVSYYTAFDSESRSGASSCTTGACTARGYGTNNGYFVFTVEPNPHTATWNQTTMVTQGRLMLLAIDGYFENRGASSECSYTGTGHFTVTNTRCNITTPIVVQAGYAWNITNSTVWVKDTTVKGYKQMHLKSGWLHWT